MINVLAVISAKPGMRDQILAHFNANVPAVLAEKGCIEYAAVVDAQNAPGFQDKLGPDTIVVIEKWESMQALADHAIAPHVATYRTNTKDLIASRKVHILSQG